MIGQVVYLSPSRVATRESCPRMDYYKYVLKWRAAFEPATLLYGTAVHAGIEASLHAQATGRRQDPCSVFSQVWMHSISEKTVKYSDGWDADSLAACGMRSLAEFQKQWDERGYEPFIDRHGRPVIERSIAVDIGGGVVLRMMLDVLALTPDLKINVLDHKTPRNPSPEGFALVADQTLAYQMGVEAIGAELGLSKIDGVGFIELFMIRLGCIGRAA